ncbi:MAG: DUF11 domain-containing protein [Blastocatellales bacterium]|nr:DUF11 domain-containing protein [Blastocatellales bacterium]
MSFHEHMHNEHMHNEHMHNMHNMINMTKRESIPGLTRPSIWLRTALILAVIVGSTSLAVTGGRGAAATGTISGVVFHDYNNNGVQDTSAVIVNTGNGNVAVAVDSGVPGVTVTAYTSANAVAGAAVTGANGTYSINTAGSTGPYRVEFTNLPAGFVPGRFGANSGTTVQFVPDGNSNNISTALVIPEDFSQNNPTLAIPCYVGGPHAGNNGPAIVAFPYTSGSARTTGDGPFPDFDIGMPPKAIYATTAQVGATWGVAWARGTRRLYASSFMKKYSDFGPSGTGAIYRIDPAGPTVTLAVDLNTIFGANTAGGNPHNFVDLRDNGNVSFNAVGKVSLGGLTISEDETKLYTINLANRALYEIPLDATPTAGNIRVTAVPLNPPGCTADGDVRPFAVKYYRGQIYVGITCTAESTTGGGASEGNIATLAGYVYTVNPMTLAFSGSPVLTVPFNYARACADNSQDGLPACFAAQWKPWVPVFRNIAEGVISTTLMGINVRRSIYPQPMLSDIEFDRGNMILGVRDRLGDQSGVASFDNPDTSDFYYGVAPGDILRACGSPGSGWTLENNGNCGGTATGGANNQQGPGSGEYYFRDNAPRFHDDTGMGSMIQLPGFPDVVATLINPIPIVPTANDDTLFDGGLRWFNNAAGTSAKNFRIYDSELATSEAFGKANGLGDLAALRDLPTIEVGNFVWYDVNKNGLQDPGEPALANVTVQLIQNGGVVGTTSTNSVGQYYFNNSNVSGGIIAGLPYEIRIALGQGALGGRIPTINDAPGTSDINDSDGVTVGLNSVIGFTIPAPGVNNHTFDFGFVDPVFDADLSITKRAAPNCVEPGSVVTYTVTVTNFGPTTATGVTVVDTPPSALNLLTVTPSQGSCNLGSPIICNLGSLAVDASATITIRMQVPQGATQKAFTNRATVTANEPDPNPNNNSAQATACLIVEGDPNQSLGPGEPFPPDVLSDQKAGSVLIFNFYSSSPSAPNQQNTRISMTNTNAGQFVYLHLFWVDGNTCGVSNNFVCLTANQTISFLASDLDPGTTGYLIAVAVDADTGCPIEFNHLIGDAYVKLSTGHQANLGALAVSRIPGEGTGPGCDLNSSTADLVFNGQPGNYGQLPRALAASSVPDTHSGNETLMVLNALGGDLRGGLQMIPNLFGVLYNDAEVSASFTLGPAGCQLRGTLNNSFIRTAPPFNQHITAGTSGWLKIFATMSRALSGAVINFNPNAAGDQGAYNQGRNMHTLTLTDTTTITMPVFPPS